MTDYASPIRIVDEDPEIRFDVPKSFRMKAAHKKDRFFRDYGLTLLVVFLVAALMMAGCIITGVIVRHNTLEEARAEYAQAIEDYKAAEAQSEQAKYWLSGDASREAWINQAIVAGAKAAGAKEMQNDVQKGGVIMTIIARMMNRSYPGTVQEVVAQEGQIPFYSEDNTYTQHDWDIAEQLLRPYLVDGIVPNGLTEDFVYAEWTPTDYVLRDQWVKDSSAHYLRYGG